MKPKFSRRTIVAVVLVVVVLAVAVALVGRQLDKPQTARLSLGSGSSAQTYKLEKVSKPADLAKGLSGRDSLASNSGMLFVFAGGDSQRCMWMKDMRFDIDIVWVNTDLRVTSVVPKLTPGTYPQSYCATGKYVIELPSGDAAARGLRIGQTVKL